MQADLARDHLFRRATGVAVHQDPAVVAGADRQARSCFCQPGRGPTAAGFSDISEFAENFGGFHRPLLRPFCHLCFYRRWASRNSMSRSRTRRCIRGRADGSGSPWSRRPVRAWFFDAQLVHRHDDWINGVRADFPTAVQLSGFSGGVSFCDPRNRRLLVGLDPLMNVAVFIKPDFTGGGIGCVEVRFARRAIEPAGC